MLNESRKDERTKNTKKTTRRIWLGGLSFLFISVFFVFFVLS